MVLDLLLAVLGLVGLVLASDFAVRGARSLARRFGVSELVVGLTLASIGTSLPEIATNVASGFASAGGEDASGVAVGNVVGSCLSQITLLLAIAGLASGTLPTPHHSLRRDGTAMILAVVGLVMVAADGLVTRVEGLLLVLAYGIYVAMVIWSAPAEVSDDATEVGSLTVSTGQAVGGIVTVVLCAQVMVDNGVDLAHQIGVSETVIGLFVGIATGAPELSIALQGIRSNAPGLSLGNLIGSNVTDPLLSFGLGALVYPVTVSSTVLWLDVPFWAAATLAAIALMWDRSGLQKAESITLLLWFGTWMWVRTVFFIDS